MSTVLSLPRDISTNSTKCCACHEKAAGAQRRPSAHQHFPVSQSVALATQKQLQQQRQHFPESQAAVRSSSRAPCACHVVFIELCEMSWVSCVVNYSPQTKLALWFWKPERCKTARRTSFLPGLLIEGKQAQRFMLGPTKGNEERDTLRTMGRIFYVANFQSSSC